MYQIVWLNSHDRAKVSSLTAALEEGVRDLGISPQSFLLVLDSADDIDRRLPAVGVWFGGPGTAQDLERLSQLLEEACTVFPVVNDLADFNRRVPEALRPVNGFEWQSDPTRLAAEILGALGLTREQRSAFISYRRTDSRGAAVQLFHRLSDCGYRAFLDTCPGQEPDLGEQPARRTGE